MDAALGADLLLVAHAALTLLAALSVPAIALGVAMRWRWARDRVVRLVHAGYVVWVGVQWLAGLPCPLTTWEARLRVLAGDVALEGTFLARLLAPWVRPESVQPLVVVLLLLLVLGTVVLALVAPPIRSRSRALR